jgi:DNA polymerase-3 subunit epsilon
VQVEGAVVGGYGPRPRALAPRSTEAERAAHAAFVASVLKDKAIWAKLDS